MGKKLSDNFLKRANEKKNEKKEGGRNNHGKMSASTPKAARVEETGQASAGNRRPAGPSASEAWGSDPSLKHCRQTAEPIRLALRRRSDASAP